MENNIKDIIADMMIEDAKNFNINNEEEKCEFSSSVKETAKVIKQAPVLVLIFREKNDNWIIGDNLSIGACIENMCLRAVELGLGTLWIRDTICVAEKIADMVGHSDMELNCCLALGKFLENPNPRPRKGLKEIVEWYDK